jgi:hypothetical protein
MGTTLTGTTPQDTYDSLIKVTDNGPLTGSLKKLTDGLGNDSSLSLSTSAASIAGTLAVSGNAAFDTNVLFVDAANNRVGIGTVVPDVKLSVIGPSGGNAIYWSDLANNSGYLGIRGGAVASVGADNNLVFETASTERMRVTTDAYVRLSASTGGIQFNGDTAAANALDDYEEGTFTVGVSFGGASVGVTTSINAGKYTKIGRQVTVNGYIQLTSKGSSTGDARITGLPFTIPNDFGNYSAVNLWISAITFANQFQANGVINSTNISLQEITELGIGSSITDADFANNSAIIFSFTYSV